jgi:hypothetical protein
LIEANIYCIVDTKGVMTATRCGPEIIYLLSSGCWAKIAQIVNKRMRAKAIPRTFVTFFGLYNVRKDLQTSLFIATWELSACQI